MSFESMAGLIEMGFVYSVALGIGLWQLISVRRELRRDREVRERASPNETTDT